MGDREGNFIGHLLCVFFPIGAGGDDFNVQLFKGFFFLLEAD